MQKPEASAKQNREAVLQEVDVPPEPGTPEAAASPLTRRLSDLLGSMAESREGDLRVRIGDVVLTTEGEITHLVVDTSVAEAERAQPKGEGGRYLVPADRFDFGTVYQVPVMSVTADALASFPVMLEGRIPAAVSPQESPAQYLLGSALPDYTAFSRQNQRLAGVEDLMLDLRNLRVVYVALETAGLLGLGRKLYAVPLSAVTRWDTDQRAVVLAITEAQLGERPGFDPDFWPAEAGVWEAGQGESGRPPAR
jgi:hypothetical protein